MPLRASVSHEEMLTLILRVVALLCTKISGLYIALETCSDLVTMTIVASGSLCDSAPEALQETSTHVSAHVFKVSDSGSYVGLPVTTAANRATAVCPVLNIGPHKPVCMATASCANVKDLKSIADAMLSVLNAMRPQEAFKVYLNLPCRPALTFTAEPWSGNKCMVTTGSSMVFTVERTCFIRMESFGELGRLGFDGLGPKKYLLYTCGDFSASFQSTAPVYTIGSDLRLSSKRRESPVLSRPVKSGSASDSVKASGPLEPLETTDVLVPEPKRLKTRLLKSEGSAAVNFDIFERIADCLNGFHGLVVIADTSTTDVNFQSPMCSASMDPCGSLSLSLNPLHQNFFSSNFHLACSMSAAIAVSNVLKCTVESASDYIVENYQAGPEAEEPKTEDPKRKRSREDLPAVKKMRPSRTKPVPPTEPVAKPKQRPWAPVAVAPVAVAPVAPEPTAHAEPEPTAHVAPDDAYAGAGDAYPAEDAYAAPDAYAAADAYAEASEMLILQVADDEAYGQFDGQHGQVENQFGQLSDMYGQFDGQQVCQFDDQQYDQSLTSLLQMPLGPSGGPSGPSGNYSGVISKQGESSLSKAWSCLLQDISSGIWSWPEVSRPLDSKYFNSMCSNMRGGRFAMPNKQGSGSGGLHLIDEKASALRNEIISAASYGISWSQVLEAIKSVDRTNKKFMH